MNISYAVPEVLPSSCGITAADIKKSRKFPPLVMMKYCSDSLIFYVGVGYPAI
jgi:hypothetical protein